MLSLEQVVAQCVLLEPSSSFKERALALTAPLDSTRRRMPAPALSAILAASLARSVRQFVRTVQPARLPRLQVRLHAHLALSVLCQMQPPALALLALSVLPSLTLDRACVKHVLLVTSPIKLALALVSHVRSAPSPTQVLSPLAHSALLAPPLLRLLVPRALLALLAASLLLMDLLSAQVALLAQPSTPLLLLLAHLALLASSRRLRVNLCVFLVPPDHSPEQAQLSAPLVRPEASRARLLVPRAVRVQLADSLRPVVHHLVHLAALVLSATCWVNLLAQHARPEACNSRLVSLLAHRARLELRSR